MRKYELTIVLAGGTTPAKKKSIQAKVEKIVSDLKGKTGKVADWGKLGLEYPIKENNTGIFLHFPLELDPAKAKEIDGTLNLEEDLLRYLLVRKENGTKN